MPGCALCFGFQRRPVFILSLLSAKKCGESLVWSEAGLVGISREASRGNEEVKHDVLRHQWESGLWLSTSQLTDLIDWFIDWFQDTWPDQNYSLLTGSNRNHQDWEIWLQHQTEQGILCVCLCPMSPSLLCSCVCRWIPALSSPCGCVCLLHNSSCTRLTSRCVSAAVPWTRRRRCWVSPCDVQPMN